MNRHGEFKATMVWAFVIFSALFIGLPLWSELGTEQLQSMEFYANTLLTFSLLALAFVMFRRLRYWFTWMLVLVVLAVLGTGIDLPHRFVVYPGKHSIVDAFLTLIAILAFWVLEKLDETYVGSNVSQAGKSNALVDEDEIIALNLNDENCEVKTAPND
ncbi:MAG: hypothetical protein IPN69_25110 [Acidobacteria bacterium]|nr:hypothetical protein [Acidobacteriota bacterium]